MPVMARETWTDERMDDLAKRVDDGFEQVDRRFAEARAETNELRRELIAAVEGVRGEVRELGQEMNRRFDGMQRLLIAALLGGLFTVIAALIAAHAS